MELSKGPVSVQSGNNAMAAAAATDDANADTKPSPIVGATATATATGPLSANVVQSNKLVLNWLQVSPKWSWAAKTTQNICQQALNVNAQAVNGAAPVGGPVSGESHGEALLANEHLMAGHGPADVDIDTDPDITEAADLAIKNVPSVKWRI